MFTERHINVFSYSVFFLSFSPTISDALMGSLSEHRPWLTASEVDWHLILVWKNKHHFVNMQSKHSWFLLSCDVRSLVNIVIIKGKCSSQDQFPETSLIQYKNISYSEVSCGHVSVTLSPTAKENVRALHLHFL